MYTLRNIEKFLKENDIKIVKIEESTDWQVEDDSIELEHGLSLQIGEDYIGINYEKDEETFTILGYYKKGKALAVYLHILLKKYAHLNSLQLETN